ncbi:MAG: hypothetical protein ABR874_16265 [Candidatus Sulfotelmatobacter sp.]|jgi:hypothetical protein
MRHPIYSCSRLLWICVLLSGLSTVGQTSAPDVSIGGSLSAKTVDQDESFQFTLTVKNKADARANPKSSLQDVTLQGIPAGYSIDTEKPICVLPLVPPRTDSCDTGANFEANHRVLIETLLPGQSITVQGYLKPNTDSAHKPALLTVVVAWIGAETGLRSSQSASLGENQVRETSQRILGWISDVFKLLAIPAILALIGWWLNDQNRKRDNAFAKASRDRDEAFADTNRDRDEKFAVSQLERQTAQHEHEQEQALRSETWKQMLPLSHNYAAKFYLPLSLAAQKFAAELEYPIAKPKLAFFYLLLCGKKMIATRNEIGGFYFKDLRGERLAAKCWEIQRLACMGKEDDNFYKAVIEAIQTLDDIDSFEAFENKFMDTSVQPHAFVDDSILNAWGFFNAWAKNSDKVGRTAQYLKCFYAVLDYESNRPYEYWYNAKDSPARLEITAETQELLADVLAGAKYTPEQIEGYFHAVVRPQN